MSKPTFNHQALTDLSWWHWAITIPLVACHLLGHAWAMPAVMLLSGIMAIYFYTRIRQIRPYPVQVRIAYVVWSAIGLLPYMHWMHWVQFFGTTAMVAVGYCPLIRMISLLSWNRSQPFTLALVWQTFVREPVADGLLTWPTEMPATVCCSLPSANTPLACALPSSKKTPIVSTVLTKQPNVAK